MKKVYKLPLETIKEVYNNKNNYIFIKSHKVMTKDDRYLNFIEHGFACKNCGLKAEYVQLEYNCQYKWHLNVYGTNKIGQAIRLTKDHIYPKSKGGLDVINNYQVLCETCNGKKKDKAPVNLRIALEKGYTNKTAIVYAIKTGRKNVLVGVN
jgi:5-methylcytosine-specific restriction endonuclease McrA